MFTKGIDVTLSNFDPSSFVRKLCEVARKLPLPHHSTMKATKKVTKSFDKSRKA